MSDRPPPATPEDPPSAATVAAVRINGVLLLALAAWFLLWSPPATIPRSEPAIIDAVQIAPGAHRHPSGVPASVIVGGFTHRCNECHRFFGSPAVQRVRRVQHTQIVLDHGLNSQCFNCHSRTDREKLALYDGTTLPFDQVPRLCAQCHGPVYRDWERGTHGKTLGSWDAASGEQVRLDCNDCHDPHAPAYEPIAPLPPPDTLRMGVQHAEIGEPPTRHTPLRRWSAGESAPSPGGRPGEGAYP